MKEVSGASFIYVFACHSINIKPAEIRYEYIFDSNEDETHEFLEVPYGCAMIQRARATHTTCFTSQLNKNQFASDDVQRAYTREFKGGNSRV